MNEVPGHLRDAVEAARHAPSIHNTQPWRWRVAGDDRLDLRAERSRQLDVEDPDGRLMVQSCGTALHHARLALAAAGWVPDVRRLPDPSDPDLLATITAVGPREPDRAAVMMREAVAVRRTDRRPVTDRPVDQVALDTLASLVNSQGIGWYALSADQVVDLTVAMAQADRAEVADDAHRAEIARWVGGERADRTGIPAGVVPDQEPQTRVPGRYFGPPGTLPVDSGQHDGVASYVLLHGDGDTPEYWLRAGEALSAAWLAATTLGLSLLPMSAVVEVLPARLALRRLLSGLGYPYLALRLGYPRADAPAAEATPRLTLDEVLE